MQFRWLSCMCVHASLAHLFLRISERVRGKRGNGSWIKACQQVSWSESEGWTCKHWDSPRKQSDRKRAEASDQRQWAQPEQSWRRAREREEEALSGNHSKENVDNNWIHEIKGKIYTLHHLWVHFVLWGNFVNASRLNAVSMMSCWSLLLQPVFRWTVRKILTRVFRG